MLFSAPPFRVRSIVLPWVCACLVLAVGCDFGAAQTAIESVSPTLDLSTTETTVSGRAIAVSTGAPLSRSARLRIQGPDRDAVLNLYGAPLSAPTLYGGSISFNVRGRPALSHPIRFQVIAEANGYQSTSAVVELTATGTKQFRLPMLSEDPTQQPEGATGVRTRSASSTADGGLQSALRVETPAGPGNGAARLFIPQGTVLRTENGPVDVPVVVDLIHYSVTDHTLDALPGNGVVVSDEGRVRRFAVGGYLNRELRTTDGAPITDATSPDGASPTTWAVLPRDAVHPSDGTPIEPGDPLALFRFDSANGTWRPDTTLRVQSRPAADATGLETATRRTPSAARLGIRWPVDDAPGTRWWAWGSPPTAPCVPEATLRVHPQGQVGPVTLRLHRPGLAYEQTVSMDALTDGARSLAALLERPTVPHHDDYTLTLRTRDGQSRTVAALSPCGGTHSVSLPSPTAPDARTDVLVQAIPECPANQKIRITDAPKIMVYYREQGTTAWHPAGGNTISWVLNDPSTPTSLKRAELRLNGLKEGVSYEFRTTYGQDQYGAAARVPARNDARVQNGRVVIPYRHPLPDLCS